MLPATVLTMYPVALEAVLGAEVALFSYLLAVRTLQRSRVIFTIFARAFARSIGAHCVCEKVFCFACIVRNTVGSVSFTARTLYICK